MGDVLVVSVGRVLTPTVVVDRADIVIERDKIKDIVGRGEGPASAERVSCEDCIAVPGFIDIHTHGYGGIDVNYAKSESDYWKLSEMLARHGVAAFLPATVSFPIDGLASIAKTIASAATQAPGAEILGIYFEGPYLNRERAGAQNPEYLRTPDVEEIRRLYKASSGLMKIMALAPELPGSTEAIRELRRLGVIPSAAHTAASFEEAMRAFDAGVRLCTHLFNGMTRFHHRAPGIAAAALVRDDVYVEFISDLIHLHAGTIRLVLKAKPSDKVVAITDSIAATGLPDGEYTLGGLRIVVKGGVSRVKETGSLAGSTLTLDRALKNLVYRLGVPLREAVRYMTSNPATLLGEADLGYIMPGYRANITLLSRENLDVMCTIVRGRVVYSKL